jgi:hypothetical protein
MESLAGYRSTSTPCSYCTHIALRYICCYGSLRFLGNKDQLQAIPFCRGEVPMVLRIRLKEVGDPMPSKGMRGIAECGSNASLGGGKIRGIGIPRGGAPGDFQNPERQSPCCRTWWVIGHADADRTNTPHWG